MSIRLLKYAFGKIALYSIFSVALTAVFAVAVLTRTSVETVSRAKHNSEPLAFPTTLTTDTWGIFNPDTGEVVIGNNLEEKRPIASVTKLFTAETVLVSAKKDELFSVSYGDVLTEGRAGKLAYGDRVTPYTLLFPLLIESSNDAATAIQRELGIDFTSALTQVKESLALTQTEIYEPSGLSPKNVSTVADLSAFYAYLRNTHPHVTDITQLYTYVGPKTGYMNNNPARTLATFTGGKHGYTTEADHTFVGTFRELTSQKEIGVVILKSDDLLHDIETILAYERTLK